MVPRDICPDQATPELMERSARLGSLLPYRKAAEAMAEFLPIQSTESFVTLRHRTLNWDGTSTRVNAPGSSRLRRLNAARWSWTSRMTQNANSS
jgi:hypothetical protein